MLIQGDEINDSKIESSRNLPTAERNLKAAFSVVILQPF